jgi:hypothetical protein
MRRMQRARTGAGRRCCCFVKRCSRRHGPCDRQDPDSHPAAICCGIGAPGTVPGVWRAPRLPECGTAHSDIIYPYHPTPRAHRLCVAPAESQHCSPIFCCRGSGAMPHCQSQMWSGQRATGVGFKCVGFLLGASGRHIYARLVRDVTSHCLSRALRGWSLWLPGAGRTCQLFTTSNCVSIR